jgi:hypothetical protein
VVSHPEVQKRLQRIVCVRIGWEAMMKVKDKYAIKVPTQGNQVLLDSKGKYLPGINPTGQRYEINAFVALLDQVLKDHPPREQTRDDVKLAWFLVNLDKPRPGEDALSIAKLERKPIATIHGPLPAWLDKPDFLRQHLRQFVWRRGSVELPRITIEQVEPERKELAAIDLSAAPAEVTKQLDQAWLEYMKVRPTLARGYIYNPHGTWLKRVMENVHEEEQQVRQQALKGLLAPPGRDSK